VVPTLDVATTDSEVFVVMEYVQGEVLSRLLPRARAGGGIPLPIVSTIMSDVLRGLHAAHEATNEQGVQLGIVHRDVSPQNIIVDVDGASRVLDFGVAKAAGRLQTTRDSRIKGKLAYMAPEQLSGDVSRQTDVYAAAVVLWELLTLRRLFSADAEPEILYRIMNREVVAPGKVVGGLPEGLDEIVMHGLAFDRSDRFATARAMAVALTHCVPPASPLAVGEWLKSLAGNSIRSRAELLTNIESSSDISAIDGPSVRGANFLGDFSSARPDAPSSAEPSKQLVRSSYRTLLFLGSGIFLTTALVLLYIAFRHPSFAEPSPPPSSLVTSHSVADAVPLVDAASRFAPEAATSESEPPIPSSHPSSARPLPIPKSPTRSTKTAPAVSTKEVSRDDTPPRTRF
jgi:serine/threonine-protein kinase